jgi:hypothetical protein
MLRQAGECSGSYIGQGEGVILTHPPPV